ncbi:MAG: PDZ domain-containing protein [Sphingomonadales bacterium]|nr:MAG: PDZ domain-containing protein [Sphingomonadales bacterium]
MSWKIFCPAALAISALFMPGPSHADFTRKAPAKANAGQTPAAQAPETPGAGGYIGVRLAPMNAELAAAFGVPEGQGTLIAEVEPDGPAARAGVKVGDVVMRVDGGAIRDARSLTDLIANRAPGARVSLTVVRDGRQVDLQATLGTRPPAEALAAAPPDRALAGQPEPARRATPASPDAKLMAKQWGALATLDNTLWAEGQDQVMDYAWTEPGQRMRITTRGLWGRRIVTVTPGGNPKLLTAQVSYPDTGDSAEGTLAPSASGYMLIAGGARETCTKSRTGLTCVIDAQLSGGKFTFDASHAFRSTDLTTAQALLANLTDVFPLRPAGKYDPVGGMFVGGDRIYRFSDGSQIVVNHWRNASGYTGLSYGLLGPDGDYRDYRDYYRMVEYANPPESLRAVVFAGTTKHTILTGISRPARILRGGRFMLERDDGTLWIVALSSDKQTLMSQSAKRQGAGWTVTATSYAHAPVTPPEAKDWGVIGTLGNRIWRGPRLLHGFEWIGRNRMLRRSWVTGYQRVPYVSSYCVIERISAVRYECKGQGPNGAFTDVYEVSAPDTFDLGGLRYKSYARSAARPDGFSVTRVKDGLGSDIYLTGDSNWASIAAEGRSGYDARRSKELMAQRRQERIDEEREAAMWRGAIAAVFGSSAGNVPNPLFQPSPSYGSGGVTGSAGQPGMGGSYSRSLPPATQAQRFQQDELERYRIRQKLYDGIDRPSVEEAARAKTDAQSRQIAGADAQRARQQATDDASEEPSSTTAQAPAPKPQPRTQYIYCWAVRGAMVLKPGGRKDRTTDIVDYDYAVRTRYMSQFGKTSDAALARGEVWATVLDRLGAAFTSALPPVTRTDWYVAEKPAGRCKIGTSYQEMSDMFNSDRDIWLRNAKTSRNPRDVLSVENVNWVPLP